MCQGQGHSSSGVGKILRLNCYHGALVPVQTVQVQLPLIMGTILGLLGFIGP